MPQSTSNSPKNYAATVAGSLTNASSIIRTTTKLVKFGWEVVKLYLTFIRQRWPPPINLTGPIPIHHRPIKKIHFRKSSSALLVFGAGSWPPSSANQPSLPIPPIPPLYRAFWPTRIGRMQIERAWRWSIVKNTTTVLTDWRTRATTGLDFFLRHTNCPLNIFNRMDSWNGFKSSVTRRPWLRSVFGRWYKSWCGRKEAIAVWKGEKKSIWIWVKKAAIIVRRRPKTQKTRSPWSSPDRWTLFRKSSLPVTRRTTLPSKTTSSTKFRTTNCEPIFFGHPSSNFTTLRNVKWKKPIKSRQSSIFQIMMNDYL